MAIARLVRASIVPRMNKIALPLLAVIALSACVGGNSGSEVPVAVAVVETPPEPAGYTLIGGPVGMAEVPGRDALREAQQLLADAGYDPGPADGLMGPRTRSALNEFQTAVGIPESGTLTVDTQGALQSAQANAVMNVAEAPAATAQPAAAAAPTASTAARAAATTASATTSSTSGSNTWTAFIAGQDISTACRSGTPDTYRFVYNAEYTEHVRLYEMYDTGDGSAVLNIVVRGPTRIGSEPSRISGRVTGKRSVNGLAPFERNTLIESLMSSGFTSSPVAPGTVLPSDGHFWVVSACRNGTFTMNAWTYPSDRWESLTFPTMLGQLDFTNVRFNPLSQQSESERTAARNGSPAQAFDLRVAADGRLALN
ncbi:MAG: peptidoglycan-binding protein [Alphaproteobacteria bacterium]